MSKLNQRIRWASLAFAGALFTLSAAGQFEVVPDHFSDSSGDQTTRGAATPSRQELKDEIATQQAALQGYYAQINRKVQEVEEARQVAVGASAVEETVYLFIDAYMTECRQLDELRSQLAPRISLAQSAISKLQDQLNQSAEISSSLALQRRPLHPRKRAGRVIAAATAQRTR